MQPLGIVARIIQNFRRFSPRWLYRNWLNIWMYARPLLIRWSILPSFISNIDIDEEKDVGVVSPPSPLEPDAEHHTGIDEEQSHSAGIVSTLNYAQNAVEFVVAKTQMLCYTNFSLEFKAGDAGQSRDVDLSGLVFMGEGPDRILPLTYSPSGHWVSENDASICLSTQVDVLVVLRGREFDDVAIVTLSHEELLQHVLAGEQGKQKMTQRAEMEDLLVSSDESCWLLSWDVEIVDADASPSPTSAQPEADATSTLEGEHVTMFHEEPASIVIVDDDAPEATNVVVAKTKMLRFTEFSLQYQPGDGEGPGDVDVSNLVFTADGTSHTLLLNRFSPDHWTVENNASLFLSGQAESVDVVLKGRDLDDVATVTLSLSQQELFKDILAGDERVQGFSQRVQMEDLSLYAETGRWFLSWQTEVVDVSPSPSTITADAAFEAKLDKGWPMDMDEGSLTSPVQPIPDHHAELDEEQVHLTGVTVVYTPDNDIRKTVNVELARIVLFAGDHDWALQLATTSANRWEVEGNLFIPIPKEAKGLTVSLQDKHMEDVAFAFVLFMEQDIMDGTRSSKLEGCTSGGEIASSAGSGGRWSVVWKIVDASKRRDDDLALRWKQLEALFPWEVAVDFPSLRQSMRAFVAHDADAYGHDILLQQAYAVQQKNIGKYTDDIAAIEEAIDVQTMLVVDPRVQKSRQMHAIATSHLGAMHHERFNKAMVSEYLDQAILLLQAAIERSSPQTNIHAECLHRLAQGYHTRYQSTSNFNDTVNAITALSEACDITRHNPHILEANLDTLLPWLSEYVEHCECTPVPLQAIACLRRVMQSFTGGPTHPLFRKMTALAVMLGHLLKERCKETQVLDELSNAIDHYRIMLSLLRHLPVDPYNTEVLWELTNLLDLRFLQTGESTDLDEAILMGTEALTLDPTPSDNASVGRLARLHFLRYNKVQRAADINDSILLRRRLLDSTSPDDPSHIDALKHLAVCLCIRGATSNREGDIEEALSISSKGLALSQLDPEQYLFFEGLRAHLLHQKFLLTRDIDHLNTATSILLQSQFNISSSAQLRLEVGAVLSGMVVSYWELHSTSHNAEHLYKAIACSQKYVAISNKPEAYHQLGNCLQRRFNITRSSSDISGAIDALSTSLRMSEASGDQPSPGLLLDLGGVIGHEASHIGDVGEYAKAEKLIKQAVLCSEEQESIHSRALVELIAHTGRKWWVDLQRTVRGSANDHEAELARQDSTVALGIRSDLATMEELLLRVPTDSPHYSRGQRMQDVMQQLQETSQNDSEYGFILLRIGYQASGNTHFRNLAIQRYRLGTSNTNENVMRRFLFARDWVEIFTVDDGGECLEAYDVAIGLLEMVVGLGQRISDRHSRVTDSGGHPRELGGGTQIWTLQRWAARLPVEAAAKAVQYDSIEKALEWLEQGRCLVWNQLQTLRTPLDDLERQEPQLAQRIRDMSKLLEHGGAEHTTLGEEVSPDFDTKIALAEGSARLARASKERDELIGQARKIPGFEDFLRPTRCSTLLQHLPDSGPVVVLNAHELRCDAIVLMRGMDEPLPVPLPKMTSSRAEAMQQGLKNEIARGLRMRQALRDGSGENRGADMEIEHEERGAQPAKCRPAIERILQELWESVVKPVLEALAFTTKSAIPTTRIWWCPTGPFSFLPIHAAGVYGRGASSECLADYAVSSYTPTVSALAARIRERRERNIGRNQLLLVSVPNAEGQASIPGTTREVQALHDFAIAEEIDHVRLEGEEATAESVMEEISRSSIVHLACHGSQNVTDPMQSGFYLHDKRLELSTIIKANVRNADLAFLSACQTSTGDEKLSNEAVHLAAGMMAAGFRGTVATMWAISDAHAPKVAEDFYSELWERGKGKGGGIDGEDAAYALHHSIQELKKIPMKNFGGVEKWFLTWVPYVHYGL